MLHADILAERARLTPDRTALVYVPTGGRFSYGELDRRTSALASRWRELGLSKGDRVGILASSRPEYLEAFFAAARTGTVLVPLNPRLTAHELDYIVRDAACRALLYDRSTLETARALQPAIELSLRLDNQDAVIPSSESGLPLAGRDRGPQHARFSRAGVGVEGPCVSPEDTLCLLYTSGTTGKPKGVIIPHRMVAWNAFNTVVSWQLRDTDISPIFTPLYHAGGLAVSLTAMFLIGGTVILHEHFDASEVLRTIAAERCTIMFGVPTTFKMLMEAPEFPTTDLGSLRWCISGGAPLPLYIIETWQKRGIVFKQGYGLTEVGVNCFAMTTEESMRKAGSIGKPMMFTEARVVTHDGDAVNDEIGELWLRGPHVCKGYWNNPEATAAALDADGWFHTGDLARRDAEGFFYIAGRLKDMMISGGANVYPAEIEAELLQHPALRDAAVIGVPHETWGEVGVAYVVARAPVTAEELTAFLAPRLAKYKIPKEFVFIAELPRSAYGKVVKPELRKQWDQRKAAGA
ncbi:MAG: class I adenylate-forming enzyme family protein [Terriglobales bacterium]